ncbi:MAG: hypothetical protein OEN01_15380 [Candidatus Krumholzibacteria bacterium]|nr:hypothetical protein [Candidatus Krumholzibacteria bacterium]
MNRVTTALVCSMALVALGNSPVAAGYSVGGSFAAPGYGARAWGKGGAAIAWGSDEGAVYWNPALLSLLRQNRLGLSYVNVVPDADARQSYVAYAHILKRGLVDEPGLEFAEHAVGVLYSNLYIKLSDSQTYSENTIRVAYAYSPLYFLTFGASFSVLLTSSDVDGFGASGTAFDAGVRLELLQDVTVGMVFRSLLSQLEFDDGVNLSLPRSYILGLAYQVTTGLVVEGDMEIKFGDFSRLVLGGEYAVYKDLLSVRGAVSARTAGESRAVGHLGIGVQVRGIHIDYGADLDADDAFADIHRFSLGLGL